MIFQHEKLYNGVILHPAYTRLKIWCHDIVNITQSFRDCAAEDGGRLSLKDFSPVIGLSKHTLIRLEHLTPESPVPQKRVFERLAQYAESRGRQGAADLFREGVRLTRTRRPTLWGRNERRSYESVF